MTVFCFFLDSTSIVQNEEDVSQQSRNTKVLSVFKLLPEVSMITTDESFMTGILLKS